MSIEALIQAHTEALLANTEAVKLLTLSLAGRTPKAEDKPAKAEKPAVKVEEKKEEPKLDPVTAADANNERNAKAMEDYVPISYEDLRAVVLKLAGSGKREEIKAVNAKHGLGNAKELLSNPEDMSSVKDQAKLEAVYADMQALEV